MSSGSSGGAGLLTPFQLSVAETFFACDAARGYLVTGGAALVASDLIARPTADLDIFAASPTTSVTPARDSFLSTLRSGGFDAQLLDDGPTFCRIIVRRGRDETLVDLAIDSPPLSVPTVTVLGPTVAPLELAGRKLLALFDRAEARDFADVYVLAGRFGADALVEQARQIDRGFDLGVLAQMMARLEQYEDDIVPLPAEHIRSAREFFRNWSIETLRGSQ